MIIFEWEFHGGEISEIIKNAEFGREIHVDSYAQKLAGKAVENIDVIDGKIDQFSTKWKRRRIAKVSLAVLRMALAEMMYSDGEIPASVAINEAVEITKKYATEADASYINGVLGGAVRAMEAAKTEA